MLPPYPILLADDSRSFSQMAAHALTARLGATVTMVHTLADAGQVLKQMGDDALVVTGLSLADGRDSQVVQFFVDRGHPPVVLTGTYDDSVRTRILDMPVVDYVLKDSPGCIDSLTAVARRVRRNRAITALVVEDSVSVRQRLAALLRLSGFKVVTAADGVAGLEQMQAHPDIRLVLTDYAMPRMDGIQMIREMRSHSPREELAIIGLSGSAAAGGRGALSARFLKSGASDFLSKPFEREELDCRIEQNMEMLESLAQLREVATRDFLTGLYNRRHFFAHADTLLARAPHPAVAMIDVDWFKRINDSHGHDVGDQVLRQMAAILTEALAEGDLLARFGGEEFCMLSPHCAPAHAAARFDRLRAAIADRPLPVACGALDVTASIGVACGTPGTLDQMLARADEALYRAKDNGRNRVEIAAA